MHHSDNRQQRQARERVALGKTLAVGLCLAVAGQSDAAPSVTSARDALPDLRARLQARAALSDAAEFQRGPRVPLSFQGTSYHCTPKLGVEWPEATDLAPDQATTLTWGGALAAPYWLGVDVAPGKARCSGGSADASAMWMAAATDAKGLAVTPASIEVGYSTPYGPAHAMPRGLEMMASTATQGFDRRIRTQAKRVAGGLEVTVEFPSCVATDLNGQPILSAQGHGNGKQANSHVAYAIEGCPASHPYRVPTLTYRLSYPQTPNALGSDSPLTLPALQAGYIAGPSEAFTDAMLGCGRESRRCGYAMTDAVTVASSSADLSGAPGSPRGKPAPKSDVDPALAKPKGPLPWTIDDDDSSQPPAAGYTFNTKVLHSGHSLTDAAMYQGRWPGHWARLIADQLGVTRNEVWPDIAGKSTIPGSSMQWRWENTSTPVDERTDIANYDVLVTTERVPLSSFDDSQQWLRTLAEHAWNTGREGAGAETFLYTTWSNIDDRDGDFRARLDSDEATWEAMADFASDTLPYQIRIVPGHRLMMRLYDDSNGDIAQYFEDTIHPNDVGAYGLALLHMAVIYRFDPRGHDHSVVELDITAAQASYMQQVVWEVANSYARTGL